MRFCPGGPSVAGILTHNFGSDEQAFGADQQVRHARAKATYERRSDSGSAAQFRGAANGKTRSGSALPVFPTRWGTLAATNKCLAQSNKSGTAGKATKKARNPASRVDPMGQIIALCLRSSRHFQCCRSHGAKEPC